MKRYDPDIEWFHGYSDIADPVMTEASDGEYVKIEDIQELLKTLNIEFEIIEN